MNGYEEMFGNITERIAKECEDVKTAVWFMMRDLDDELNSDQADGIIKQGFRLASMEETRFWLMDNYEFDDEDLEENSLTEKIFRLYSLTDEDESVFNNIVDCFMDLDEIQFGSIQFESIIDGLLINNGYDVNVENYSMDNLPR